MIGWPTAVSISLAFALFALASAPRTTTSKPCCRRFTAASMVNTAPYSTNPEQPEARVASWMVGGFVDVEGSDIECPRGHNTAVILAAGKSDTSGWPGLRYSEAPARGLRGFGVPQPRPPGKWVNLPRVEYTR